MISQSLMAASLPVALLATTNNVEAQVYHKTNVGFFKNVGPNPSTSLNLPIGPSSAPIGSLRFWGGFWSTNYAYLSIANSVIRDGSWLARIDSSLKVSCNNVDYWAGLAFITWDYFHAGPWYGKQKSGFIGFVINDKPGWAWLELNTKANPWTLKITEYAYSINDCDPIGISLPVELNRFEASSHRSGISLS